MAPSEASWNGGRRSWPSPPTPSPAPPRACCPWCPAIWPSSPAEARRPRERERATGPILLFIAGFTVVFTFVFGFAASSIGRWLRLPTGQRIAGAVVLAFGLFMVLYAFRARVPWLYREERPLLSKVRPGPAGAFPLGMAFAV